MFFSKYVKLEHIVGRSNRYTYLAVLNISCATHAQRHSHKLFTEGTVICRGIYHRSRNSGGGRGEGAVAPPTLKQWGQ